MIYALVWKNNYMKTKNILIGLGIAAGAFLTVSALNRSNGKIKQYVNDKIKQVSTKKKEDNKDINYV